MFDTVRGNGQRSPKLTSTGDDELFIAVHPLVLVVPLSLEVVVEAIKQVGERVVAPLRVGEESNPVRLSSQETATTTYNRAVGWSKRPPAGLECPRCEHEIYQPRSGDAIDCPRCVAEFDAADFTDLNLLYMKCPVCRSDMQHGQRHPDTFDFPEWATCDNCRYHWEFKHFYSG